MDVAFLGGKHQQLFQQVTIALSFTASSQLLNRLAMAQ